jgi:hypothetical protein
VGLPGLQALQQQGQLLRQQILTSVVPLIADASDEAPGQACGVGSYHVTYCTMFLQVL